MFGGGKSPFGKNPCVGNNKFNTWKNRKIIYYFFILFLKCFNLNVKFVIYYGS